MVRDPRAWLWDIQQACQNAAIHSYPEMTGLLA